MSIFKTFPTSFFIKLSCFVFVVVFIDLLLGGALGFLQCQAKSGNIERENRISNVVSSDVLIFGSSRGIQHYVPAILEDSLGMSVYNCGQPGNGIIYEYAKLQTLLARYTPKVLILDTYYHYDTDVDNNMRYIARLKFDYGISGVDSVMENIDPFIRIKMLSQAFRYNSRVLEIVRDYRAGRNLSLQAGYIPHPGKGMLQEPATQPDTSSVNRKVDPLKLYYFEKLLKENYHKSKIIVMVSPMYDVKSSKIFDPIRSLCEKYDIPFLDHFADPQISTDMKYFANREHLNDFGARKYTEVIAGELKNIIQSQVGHNKGR